MDIDDVASTAWDARNCFYTGEFVQLMGRIRRGEARDKDYDRLNKVGACVESTSELGSRRWRGMPEI